METANIRLSSMNTTKVFGMYYILGDRLHYINEFEVK